METPLFPMFLDLSGRHCLVVGAGPEAARRVALLDRCGARVAVCARLADAPPLEDMALVMAADTPLADAEALAQACEQRGIPVNVADAPQFCTFIMPAIVDRAPVTVAISTGGRSPMLAALLRECLDRHLPLELGALASLAARFRNRVRCAVADPTARRQFWRRVLTGRIAALVLGGREPEAEAALGRMLADAAGQAQERDAA